VRMRDGLAIRLRWWALAGCALMLVVASDDLGKDFQGLTTLGGGTSLESLGEDLRSLTALDVDASLGSMTDAEEGCKDNPIFARKYSEKMYAKTTHASRCMYYKSLGYCARSKQIKGKCPKSCTSSGRDSPSWAKPFTARKKYVQGYASRCAYYKDIKRCNHRYFIQKCSKTCTGSGKDTALWAKPFVAHKAVVLQTKVHRSRCAYYKGKGLCRNRHIQGKCKATCKACKKSDPVKSGPVAQARAATAAATKGDKDQWLNYFKGQWNEISSSYAVSGACKYIHPGNNIKVKKAGKCRSGGAADRCYLSYTSFFKYGGDDPVICYKTETKKHKLGRNPMMGPSKFTLAWKGSFYLTMEKVTFCEPNTWQQKKTNYKRRTVCKTAKTARIGAIQISCQGCTWAKKYTSIKKESKLDGFDISYVNKLFTQAAAAALGFY